MSRVGKNPIKIPEGVTVEVKGSEVTVKGPKGELNYTFRPEVKITLNDNELTFTIKDESKAVRSLWGTTRALIANMILGVTEGFEKKLELVGVGYRISASGKGVSMTLGYSHPVEFEAPEGIKISVEDNKNFTVTGIDKQLVGLTAAKMRSLRKPEVYKGKGVKYADEVIKTKPGKAGKAA